MIDLFENFTLSKVLDFENAPLDKLPKELGNLVHLKYLCLRGAKVKVLPKSIGKLRNVQTFDVSNTLALNLPIEVNKLRNLRHLMAGFLDVNARLSLDTYCGVNIGKGIGWLEELQTLTRVEAYPSIVGFVKEMQKLRKLKHLNISRLTAEMGKALGVSIEKMNHLEELYLTSINEDAVRDLKYITTPLPFLRYLQLVCQLQQLPNWISELHNLRGLHLGFSRLIDEPLKCLKGLPNLAYLGMYQTFKGEEFHFEAGGFQKLKQLRLFALKGLKVVNIDRGALPLLEGLKFGSCPLMEEMPSDIQHLKKLNLLAVHYMTREFVVRMQPDGGADNWKIQHVPSVFISYYAHEGFAFDSYRLGIPELLQLLQEQAS